MVFPALNLPSVFKIWLNSGTNFIKWDDCTHVQPDVGTAVLLLSFAIILISIRLKVHLAIAISLGAFLLYAAYGFGINALFLSFESMGSYDSLRLLALIFLVIFMSRLMKVAGTLDMISDSLKKAFSDARLSYGAIPAIIGLLPMPAGALISAQMVNKAADELETTPEERTFVNYWFRHVWEFSWPFYQGVIYTAVLLGLTVKGVVGIMFPMTLISIGVGYFFGIRGLKKGTGEKNVSGILEFLVVLWPIWLVIFISLGAGIDLMYALVITDIAIISVYSIGRHIGERRSNLNGGADIRGSFFGKGKGLGIKGTLSALEESLRPDIFFIILAIMVFKGALSDTDAVSALPAFMEMHGLPSIMAVILLPMIVGVMAGITVAFVGITFPIILPMLMPGGVLSPSMLALAYLSGFIGVLFSPMHLCLIFSTEYFGADMSKVYRKLAMPLLSLFVLGGLYAWFIGVV